MPISRFLHLIFVHFGTLYVENTIFLHWRSAFDILFLYGIKILPRRQVYENSSYRSIR